MNRPPNKLPRFPLCILLSLLLLPAAPAARGAIVNRHLHRTVFVSIHTNSAHREGACGIEAYYDTGRTSAHLAAAIYLESRR